MLLSCLVPVLKVWSMLDPLQDYLSPVHVCVLKIILDLRRITWTPHVGNFGPMRGPCELMCQFPPVPPNNVVQTCPARSSGCRTPPPPRPASTRPPRNPPAPNQAGTSAWRQQNSSNQNREDQDRVQDHTRTGTGSDRVRCDPIRTRSRVIQIRSQI